MIKKYDNYIFDLYGTLVDIHTDEEEPTLWEKMADRLKNDYGAAYDAKELKKSYGLECQKEEKKLKKENNAEYPEIKIENMWASLIYNKSKKEISPDKLEPLCIFFRESSRDKLKKYKDTDSMLSLLKENGKGVFLLSNAQRFFTEKELKDTGLQKYFDDIFISSDHGIKKPQKEYLEKLIKKNGLKPEGCVMIGNEPFSDGGVARKNDIDFIIVQDGDFAEVMQSAVTR